VNADVAPAWLVVRATVANAADRAAFDRWYHNEHLPDAKQAFG
jgi:tRNA nucleotidyltransferase (CCA-adding enzyme)